VTITLANPLPEKDMLTVLVINNVETPSPN
jgi:hypothetical protein